MIHTPYLIVRIGAIHRRLREAAAKGFRMNDEALKLVYELKDIAESLEHKAESEYMGIER